MCVDGGGGGGGGVSWCVWLWVDGCVGVGGLCVCTCMPVCYQVIMFPVFFKGCGLATEKSNHN